MIRQATPTDFAELAEIFHDASLISHPFIDPEFIVTEKHRLQNEHLPLGEAYVYAHSGAIQGFISMTRNHINGLFVRADHQRTGIGTKLLRHVKERHDNIKLRCFVDNYQAQRFYHAQGFEITEEHRHPQLENDEYVMQWPS
jgi:putative acetyltransferase